MSKAVFILSLLIIIAESGNTVTKGMRPHDSRYEWVAIRDVAKFAQDHTSVIWHIKDAVK